jgi:hypothetical protein
MCAKVQHYFESHNEKAKKISPLSLGLWGAIVFASAVIPT